ncbi:hypothetical protein QTP88_001731 [Uroleucon formosanum]
MNIIVTTPKPFIFKSIDCGSNRHTAEYISAEISSVIEELGKEKCLGVITDNASNMKKAWKLLQADDKFKSLPIAYYSCVSHTLNLLMLNVVKMKTCFEIENISKAIIKNIISTHILKANFTRIQKEKNIKCSLKLPVKTRWGSFINCLESLIKNKSTLQNLAVSDDINIVEKLDKTVKRKILSDQYWNYVENFITLVRPIVNWITILESDMPRLSVIDERYNMAIHPIHFAADLVDLNYQGKNLKDGCDVEGILFLKKVAKVLLKDNEYDKIMIEVTEFCAHESFWAKDVVWCNCSEMDARTWWNGICSNTKLSTVASAILSLPASSVATERSFSVYFHIHNKKRNRLTNTNASKLLFIQANMNNINFLSPDKSNNKILSTSTSSTNLVSNNYVQSVKLNILLNKKNLFFVLCAPLNEDDSEEKDTEEENYDTEDLVESYNLSDEHYVLSDDEFYESYFK